MYRLCIVYVSCMYRISIVYLSCKLRSYMRTSTRNNGNYKGVAGKLYRSCRENVKKSLADGEEALPLQGLTREDG